VVAVVVEPERFIGPAGQAIIEKFFAGDLKNIDGNPVFMDD
jgi:hypothetical protein